MSETTDCQPIVPRPECRGCMALTFGTAYYPDHWPESDWARDLDRMAAAGVTMVRFGEFSWSWYEPGPGQFNFDAFDRFVAAIEERKLQLCLCTPTATPPPWFDRLYPDGRLLDMQGRRCLSHRHFWCWNHSASWAQAAATITRLAVQYRDRPCLWGWQIDNEPNYAEQNHLADPERMYDHNPYAREAWIEWLRGKYGDSLDELNRAWWTNFWSQRYGTWDDLLVPRGRTNPHTWLDWMRWREANLAEFVARQHELLRRLCPDKMIGCNIPETGVPLSLAIGQDYWAQAAGLDWVGTDLYQATGDRTRDLARHAYSTDLLRGAAKASGAAFYVSETQAGPHERHWPNPFAPEGFGPDYLRDCTQVFAARGAEQVWWFLWRPTLGGHEIGMNGLQALDGSDTPRTAEAGRLAREGKQLAALRTRFLRRPLAVVHYSRDSLRLASAFSGDAQSAEETLSGWHALLEAAGYRIDFLNDDGLRNLGPDTDALLVLPFTLVADDSLVASLSVHAGPLIAGPMTAGCNEHGHLHPTRLPPALARAWGVDYGLWRDTGPLPTAPGLPTLRGWRELLPHPDSVVRGRLSNGHPGVVSHRAASLCAIDLGRLMHEATPSQRKTLVQWVAKVGPRRTRARP